MSFLPYDKSSPRIWWMAGGGATLVHAALIAVGLGSAQGLLALAATPPKSEPQYTITLTPLDSDTIAGMTLQEGQANADDADGIDPISAEVAPPIAGERLAAVAPSAAELQLPQAEAIRPIQPAPTEPDITNPLIPKGIAPEVRQGTTVTPAPVTAIAPAPVAIEAIRPTRPITTASPPTEAAPTTAALPANAAPSAQDLAVADLLRRIKSAPHSDCMIALPRRDGEDGVGLALIAGNDRAMTTFSETLLTQDDANLRQTRTLVDERQCSALNYIRQNADYPATQMGVQLDAVAVPSGGQLTGTLRGTAGRYLTLLLVDNNGVVQDLQRFVSFTGNFTRFDVPVTRDGPPRDTKQLLLAIATRSPAPVLRERAGQLAQDVFAGLAGEVAEGAALAIATFDVR